MSAMVRYHFDCHGGYRGYVDDEGRYFDREGTYRGYVSRSGDEPASFFDAEGNRRGFINRVGSFYDERSKCLGYLR